MQPTRPAFIFFDLDDTLTQDQIATANGVDALFEHYFSDEIPQRHQLWDQALKAHYPHFLNGEISATELKRRRMRFITNNVTLDDSDADQMFAYFMEHYIRNTCLYEDCITTLETLKAKGLHLGVISNGPDDMQQRKVDNAGIRDYFELILTAEKAGIGKPNPQIFHTALEQVNITPEQCWYIGDHLDKDAKAACAAGLQGIWLNRDLDKQHLFEGYQIATLQDLCSWL